jgi:GntR family transcriptional regulator, arabinose operon transcriptional repressor
MTMAAGPNTRVDERTQPKYEQLKQFVLAEVQAGRLKPGEPLPTEVELAHALGVARNTVRQALGELDRDGVIRRIRGKGTFVRLEPAERTVRCLNVFGLVLPETQTGQYPALLSGFEAAAKAAHNQVIVSSTDNDIDKQGNVILQLLQKDVAGVAIVPSSTPTPAYQILPLRQRGIPVVFCHRRVDGIRAPLLVLPHREVGRRVGEALVKHGHRRAALFSVRLCEMTLAYEAGLREAMRAGGGDLPDAFVYHGDPDLQSPNVLLQEEAVWRALEAMFSGPNRPTGIMASFDTFAELIYLLLGRMKLRVPEDVSLVGFGGKTRQRPLTQRLTSVVIDGEDLGRRAGELLSQMRDGQRPLDDNEEVMMPLELSDGETLGAAPGGPVLQHYGG